MEPDSTKWQKRCLIFRVWVSALGFLFENDALFSEKKNLNSEFESEYDLS